MAKIKLFKSDTTIDLEEFVLRGTNQIRNAVRAEKEFTRIEILVGLQAYSLWLEGFLSNDKDPTILEASNVTARNSAIYLIRGLQAYTDLFNYIETNLAHFDWDREVELAISDSRELFEKHREEWYYSLTRAAIIISRGLAYNYAGEENALQDVIRKIYPSHIDKAIREYIHKDQSKMDIKDEFLLTLFDPKTITNVINLISSDDQIFGFEDHDLSFRLFKATPNSINLEVLTTQMHEAPVEFTVQTATRYLLPIGFYTWDTQADSMRVIVNILGEYEKRYHKLVRLGLLKPSKNIATLSFMENALIGAFSMDSYIEIKKIFKALKSTTQFIPEDYDKWLNSNGIKMKIVMAFDKTPQIFMEDENGDEVGIAGFIQEEEDVRFATARKFDQQFKKLHAMELFSGLKSI